MKNFIVFFFLSVICISCEKDDKPESIIPDVPDGTVLISSTIDKEEIGGANLAISSVYYADAPINNNSFKTIVSQEGTQVVLVIDEDESLRGLSYTEKKGETYELVPVDATSTVNALFLLTPGMTTTSPTETNELINKLKSLSSYAKFRNEIQQNLKLFSIAELLEQNSIQELFSNVVIEYTELDSEGGQLESANSGIYGSRLSVLKNGDGKVEISNKAFRRINVYRSYLDNNQDRNTKLLFESMNGGVGASWGSLFTFSMFEPTIKVDEDYLPPTQSTTTEYWIIGPGLGDSEEMPPSYINTNINEALGETCIYYVLFPMLDILCGTSKLIDDPEIPRLIWRDCKDINKLGKILNANSRGAANRAFIDLAVSIGKSAVAIPAIAGFIGISSSAAGSIGTCLTILSIPMSLTNISAFTADYIKQPKYSKFTIATQLNPPKLLLPVDNSQEESASVKLSWEKNSLAWHYYIEVSKNADFSDAIKNSTDGVTTNLALTLEPSTIYYWKVYCTKADGSPSDWSEVRSFTTGEEEVFETGTFSDERDGHVYKTVKIGDQIWMAENLAYNSENSWAYNDNEGSVVTYGRLYSRGAAQAVCPSGWHLPSDAEWEQLAEYVKNQKGADVGGYLKATSGWSNNGNGSDDFGFAGLPGGLRSGAIPRPTGGYTWVFDYRGSFGYWWSSNNSNNGENCRKLSFINLDFARESISSDAAVSVRCIKD